MPIDPRLVAARLVEYRGQRSITEVAAQAGIAKSYLLKLESGEVENPGLSTLDAIAKVLGVTVASLVRPGAVGEAGQRHRRPTLQPDQLPESLRQFVAERRKAGEEIPDDLVRTLAQLQYRGKRPENPADWFFIYEALRRSTRRP